MVFSRQQCQLSSQIRQQQQHDPLFGPIITSLKTTNIVDSNYSYTKGLLMWKGKILIPNDSTLKSQLLQEFYASWLGGHASVFKTYAQLASQYYWPSMKNDV